eukprot:273834-Chlamydomonas_euryale.AAC.7
MLEHTLEATNRQRLSLLLLCFVASYLPKSAPCGRGAALYMQCYESSRAVSSRHRQGNPCANGVVAGRRCYLQRRNVAPENDRRRLEPQMQTMPHSIFY